MIFRDAQGERLGFNLTVEMREEMRGLLTARMAEGEFEKREEVLFKLARSLRGD